MRKAGWCWPMVFTMRVNSAAHIWSMPPRLQVRWSWRWDLHNAGIFANDDDMYNRFHAPMPKLARRCGACRSTMNTKSRFARPIADIMNTGGRWGGAITAAMFLKEFAEDTPWIHLDIAGTAWMEDQKPWIAKGPSGIALRSLVEFVKSFAV